MTRRRLRWTLAAAAALAVAATVLAATTSGASAAPAHFFIDPVLEDGTPRPEGPLLAKPGGPAIPGWRFVQSGTLVSATWCFSREPSIGQRLRALCRLPVDSGSFWAHCVPRAPHGVADRTEWVRTHVALPADDFPPATDLVGAWRFRPESHTYELVFKLRVDGTVGDARGDGVLGRWGAHDDVIAFTGEWLSDIGDSALLSADRRSFVGVHAASKGTRER